MEPQDKSRQQPGRQPATRRARKKRPHTSMHEGIAVWCDCCSCEAEPYWQAVAGELGIDLGSDYEDEDEDGRKAQGQGTADE